MIHVLIENSAINSKPKIIHNSNGMVACVFSVKCGTDIVTVATEPNAINLFKKGDSVTIKGVFSPNNAIVGATEIHKGNVPLSIETQNFPAETFPTQTRRKPSNNGTFEVPKSIRRVSEKEEKKVVIPQTASKTQIVKNNEVIAPVVVEPANNESDEVEKETVKIEIPVVSTVVETNDNTTTETDSETGLPLPNFSEFNKTTTPKKEVVEDSTKKVTTTPVTSHTPTKNGAKKENSQKKSRWSNADFAM